MRGHVGIVLIYSSTEQQLVQKNNQNVQIGKSFFDNLQGIN